MLFWEVNTSWMQHSTGIGGRLQIYENFFEGGEYSNCPFREVSSVHVGRGRGSSGWPAHCASPPNLGRRSLPQASIKRAHIPDRKFWCGEVTHARECVGVPKTNVILNICLGNCHFLLYIILKICLPWISKQALQASLFSIRDPHKILYVITCY